MIRIILPLAVIAALLFAPIFSETVKGSDLGARTDTLTGYDYIANTVDCWRNGTYSIAGDCKPKGELKGLAIFAAVFVSAVAGVLGVVGLLPVIGRLTSFITTLAGVIVIAAIGYYALTQMGGGDDGESLQWGTYLAGGGGLLTLISGLAGIRGR